MFAKILQYKHVKVYFIYFYTNCVLQITYSARKEFVDARGVTQVDIIEPRTKIVNSRIHTYVIEDLRPFTTYTVNVTALAPTKKYKPPAKITVTTQMAGEFNNF